MTSEQFQHLEKHGACVDLSARAKWRLSGVDAVRYLNGQVTNDVRKATAHEAIYACVTNAKGKIEGDVFIHVSPDGGALLLDAEPSLREPLAARLERYIVADDVELKDASDEWGLLHFSGAATQEFEAWGRGYEGIFHVVKASRFGMCGFDVWTPRKAEGGRRDVEGLTGDDIETWRIIRGLPRWPNELNGETFPPEAGIQECAMDFTKGCYIGQEVLSRIKTTGKMPRKLIRFRVLDSGFAFDDAGSPASWKIGARGDDGSVKESGVVTSACLHPALDRCVGLAYVRASADVTHSVLLAGTEAARIFARLEII